MTMRFRNRTEAGQLLAKQLTAYAGAANVLVLGLPRGGVPVAYEVAKALNAPLDVCLVRKLGVPGHEELAMGAIASGSIRVLNDDVVNSLGIKPETIERVTTQELRELQRRDRNYRGEQPQPDITNHTIILVDDGIATGSTMLAAITTLQKQQPEKIIVAIPVAEFQVYEQFKSQVDEVVCLITPERMCAIGLWYEDFSQTTDAQVRELLKMGNKE
ncbi:MAG: phosphoribosyltransferase [Goleter apudmare HA4340-LM2]|jgi:predicted phosphoribosyltransferase|nr:phosphoribosyltransferase [Goleter apudmare HA4340-LM2]